MGKNKQPPSEPEGDQPPPTPPGPEGTGAAPTDPKDLVRSVLAELAASGEIFGGGGEGDPAPDRSGGPPPAGGGPDLEAAIARVLERRETESKAREKQAEQETALADLKERVGQGIKRVRRWFEPASPWGD